MFVFFPLAFDKVNMSYVRWWWSDADDVLQRLWDRINHFVVDSAEVTSDFFQDGADQGYVGLIDYHLDKIKEISNYEQLSQMFLADHPLQMFTVIGGSSSARSVVIMLAMLKKSFKRTPTYYYYYLLLLLPRYTIIWSLNHKRQLKNWAQTIQNFTTHKLPDYILYCFWFWGPHYVHHRWFLPLF